MGSFLLGLLLGVMGAWLIAVRVFGRPSSDQQDLHDKLHPEVRRILSADARRHLTVSDIRELLGAAENAPGGSPLHRICPQCGSDRLYHGKDYAVEFTMGSDGKPRPAALSHETIECEDCNWKITASAETDAEESQGPG